MTRAATAFALPSIALVVWLVFMIVPSPFGERIARRLFPAGCSRWAHHRSDRAAARMRQRDGTRDRHGSSLRCMRPGSRRRSARHRPSITRYRSC